MILTPLLTLAIVIVVPAIYVAIVVSVVLYQRKLEKAGP